MISHVLQQPHFLLMVNVSTVLFLLEISIVAPKPVPHVHTILHIILLIKIVYHVNKDIHTIPVVKHVPYVPKA
jgi:hypothetical protein